MSEISSVCEFVKNNENNRRITMKNQYFSVAFHLIDPLTNTLHFIKLITISHINLRVWRFTQGIPECVRMRFGLRFVVRHLINYAFDNNIKISKNQYKNMNKKIFILKKTRKY